VGVVDQALDTLGKLLWVVLSNYQAGLAVAYRLGYACYVGGNTGSAKRHCFQQHCR